MTCVKGAVSGAGKDGGRVLKVRRRGGRILEMMNGSA